MRTPIIHAVIALALGVSAVVAYGMWYAVVKAKSAVVADLQSQIDAKRESAMRISAARAALSEIAGDEAVVQDYFVPETGVVAFIDSLEARGRSGNATVSVLSVSKDAAVKGRSAFTFSISITGTFDAVMRTVGTIEYAPYAVSLTSLSLGQGEADVWHASVKLSVGSSPTNAAASTTNQKSVPKTTP